MAYYKKTNSVSKFVFSRGVALLVIFLIIFVGYGVVSVMRKSMEASRSRKIAETQAAALKEKQTDLTAKISALKTPEGEETALREQFPVVKAGEHVVVITDPPSGENTGTAQSAEAVQKKNFWNFLRNLFH